MLFRSQDGIVEDVEIGRHAVVPLVVEQHLDNAHAVMPRTRPARLKHGRVCLEECALLTWADLRTAILRTMGGVFLPKDAGTDFCMLPTVIPPYLDKRRGK